MKKSILSLAVVAVLGLTLNAETLISSGPLEKTFTKMADNLVGLIGRVCTDTFSNAGTSTDCDYPPVEKMNWTIDDYKKSLKR